MSVLHRRTSNYISEFGLAGLQTCFSAACSVSSATSLGLRIFRNTPTLLNQAEYRSMTTEAPWALRPQKFLPVTVTAQGLNFYR